MTFISLSVSLTSMFGHDQAPIEDAVEPEWRDVEPAEDIVEQAIHFTMQGQEGACPPRHVAPERRRLRFQGMRSLTFMVIPPLLAPTARPSRARET